MRFVEKAFHIVAAMLLALAYWAYMIKDGTLLAVVIFNVAIAVEILLLLIKEDSEPLVVATIKRVRRKVLKAKRKQAEYVCNKCKASTPVMKQKELMSDELDKDEMPLSTMGAAISNAIESKNNLTAAMGAAIDAASDFGYELGRIDNKAEVLAVFDRAIKALDEKQVVELETMLNLLAMVNAPIEEETDEED